MKITFCNYSGIESISIEASQHCEKHDTYVYLFRHNGEGGQFNADDVTNVIYDALDKYLEENM